MNTDELRRRQVFVVHRSPHHAEHAGYSLLPRYAPGAEVIYEGTNLVPYRLAGQVSQRWRSRPLYATTSVELEAQVLRSMLRRRLGLVHFLSAERDALMVPKVARFRSWTVAGTFHKPPAQLDELGIERSLLDRLDLAIALSRDQAAWLESRTRRVEFVPHGVDTAFFRPRDSGVESDLPAAVGPPRFLFVGQHLRDLPTLSHAFDLILEHTPEAQLVLVTPRSSVDPAFVRPEAWTFAEEVSDLELRSLYQTATALILPLTAATANNSLLEAMACGTPIVSTDVGGVGDYLPADIASICPVGDAEALASASIRIMSQSTNERAGLQRSLRHHSLSFAWDEVIARLDALHLDLLR